MQLIRTTFGSNRPRNRYIRHNSTHTLKEGTTCEVLMLRKWHKAQIKYVDNVKGTLVYTLELMEASRESVSAI